MPRYFLVLLLQLASAARVVDMAGNYSIENFACLKSNGVDRAIIRAYHSYGKIDLDARSNIYNSNKAGLSTDVYMFPCRGRNATQQVSELVEYLDSMADSSSFYSHATGTIWLDIETNPSLGCSWDIGTKEANCDYIGELVRALGQSGREVGIYASHYMWTQILGGGQECQQFTDKLLWYAHYDQKENFDDWKANPFGGWRLPSLKQYTDGLRIFGLLVDMSYY